MSFDAIHNYYREVENLKHYGGTHKETSIRTAFQKLLDIYANSKDLILVPEVAIKGKKGKDVYPDGTLKDILRQDWGYWESKDEYDDIDLEIQKKFDKGYPNDNILFEDGNTAILYQNGNQVSRIKFADDNALDHILKSFIGFQRPEVAQFRKAIELFKTDVPKVTEALRHIIEIKAEQNPDYMKKRDTFLALCKDVINPAITKEDIREMVIQHILTADIFNTIFDEPNFHRENNIACELQNLVSTFFTREIRESTLAGIKHYYDTINARAAQIADHHEKQKFLKVVYETFYKSYSPKKADRLGVVYTPNEIVRFMIDSTDYLLGKHFDKQLEDTGVDILDPATGTGTFICDIIDHIRKDKLPYKYKNELHANEVEILPYYIANLNIEFTYKQKTGQYAEFANLCFVDTLDNMGFDYKDKQDDIFSLSDENSDRIKRQNEKKISVIIGNPPYNANQMNENENNKNREYPVIDQRIKDTYIKYSTAQKTKVYDMYARFYRWAMDRLDDNGIIAFITNRSFIESRTFDGFRKVIEDEFDFAYIIDTKSDVRTNPKIAGTTHNVFGIQTGVAIMFLVRKRNLIKTKQNEPSSLEFKLSDKLSNLEFKLPNGTIGYNADNVQLGLQNATTTPTPDAALKSKTPKTSIYTEAGSSVLNSKSARPCVQNLYHPDSAPCRIYYIAMEDNWRKEDKLLWLSEHCLSDLLFEHIKPDKDNNWLHLTDNDWDEMIAVADNDVKLGQSNKAIFQLFSNGVVTARDEWVYDDNAELLESKVSYLIDSYNDTRNTKSDFESNGDIKWTRAVKHDLLKGIIYKYDKLLIRKSLYRPFVAKQLYFSQSLNEMQYRLQQICFNSNLMISFVAGNRLDFATLATNLIPNYAIYSLDPAQCTPLYRYDKDGNRHDNITDWALAEFRTQHTDESITKENIFHYVYGVLHNPTYRVKYEQNLKRSLPRIPYYSDFWQWVEWGKKLMELHIGFETVEPYPLGMERLVDDYWSFFGEQEAIDAYYKTHPELSRPDTLKEVSEIVN